MCNVYNIYKTFIQYISYFDFELRWQSILLLITLIKSHFKMLSRLLLSHFTLRFPDYHYKMCTILH